MSQGNWDEPNPYRDPQPEGPAAKKSSGGKKILIILLVLGGGGLLLCCGCMGYFYTQAKQSFSDSPEVVRERTQEMLNISVPGDFHPVMTMGMNLYVIPKFQIALYQPPTGEGMLMFMQIEVPLDQAGMSEQQMRQALEQQQGNQQIKDLDIEETETREFEVGGKKVEVVFAKGTDSASGKEYQQVMGAFPSKSGKGSVLMMLQIEAEAYNEEQIVEMIESIE